VPNIYIYVCIYDGSDDDDDDDDDKNNDDDSNDDDGDVDYTYINTFRYSNFHI
jgi:hypothetical protein